MIQIAVGNGQQHGKVDAMQNKSMYIWILILLAAAGVPGCSKKADRSTPRAALDRTIGAMMELDRETFLAGLTGTPQEMRAAGAFMDFMIAMRDFKQAVIAEWGEEGWRPFTQEGGAKLSFELSDNRDQLDRAQITVDGDRATCTMPGGSQVVRLSRTDGQWLIHVGDILTGDNRQSDTWSKMARLLRDKKDRIGVSGVTPQSLDAELGRAVMQTMHGEGG